MYAFAPNFCAPPPANLRRAPPLPRYAALTLFARKRDSGRLRSPTDSGRFRTVVLRPVRHCRVLPRLGFGMGFFARMVAANCRERFRASAGGPAPLVHPPFFAMPAFRRTPKKSLLASGKLYSVRHLYNIFCDFVGDVGCWAFRVPGCPMCGGVIRPSSTGTGEL